MKISIALMLISISLFSCKKPKPLDMISGLPEDGAEQTVFKVSDVLKAIKRNLTCEWNEPTVDEIKTGSVDAEVTGIVTTFMATMEVIEKAKTEGFNMIITHEPTFYNHLDDLEPLKSDPVQQAKLNYINEAGITIFRFHDFWHKTRPDGINKGLINALGWQEYGNSDQMIFDIPEMNLEKLSSRLSKIFNTTTIRVVGSAQMELHKVGIVPGAWGYLKQIEWLNKSGVDAVIVGESREWETVEYVRDMNELGFPKGLIIMGHADSEDPGMAYCAEWMRGFIKEVPIRFIRAGNPLWSPE